MIKVILAVTAFATIQAIETPSQSGRPTIPIPTNFKIHEKVYELDANNKMSNFMRTNEISYYLDGDKLWSVSTEINYPYI